MKMLTCTLIYLCSNIIFDLANIDELGGHEHNEDEHARSNTFTPFKIGSQSSMISFYGGQTTILDLPNTCNMKTIF